MTSTGIVRKVDELGRVVIPIELRRTLDIAERDQVEIFTEDDSIVLRKYAPEKNCVFCGNKVSDDGFRQKGKPVCRSCVAAIKRKNL